MNQNGFPTPKIKTGFDFDNDMVGFFSVKPHECSSSQEVTNFTFLAFCIQN